MKNQRQSGLATVEFAMVGSLFFLLLFAIIEIGRLLYTWNTLAEVTRRGARVAAVCPKDDPAVAHIAIFSSAGGSDTSPILNGLGVANININYFAGDGVTLGDQTTTQYVQVSITGFPHSLLIPGLPLTVTAPPFTTTLRRESLGEIDGVPTACNV